MVLCSVLPDALIGSHGKLTGIAIVEMNLMISKLEARVRDLVDTVVCGFGTFH